jgi:hypothetical protein
MPVLSFNGSQYDIYLMKQFLHKSLEDCGEEVSFTIKKDNSCNQYLGYLKTKFQENHCSIFDCDFSIVCFIMNQMGG